MLIGCKCENSTVNRILFLIKTFSYGRGRVLPSENAGTNAATEHGFV